MQPTDHEFDMLALELLVAVQLLYQHGASRNLNPGIWTTSIKLVARLEASLEIDVHVPSSGSGKSTATKPPDHTDRRAWGHILGVQ